MKKQLRNLAEYLQSVREEERKRIARELHDEIGQALTGIKLVLERSVREQSGSVQASLIQALAVANELIGRVRDFSLELRPAMLDDLGLLAALRCGLLQHKGNRRLHGLLAFLHLNRSRELGHLWPRPNVDWPRWAMSKVKI